MEPPNIKFDRVTPIFSNLIDMRAHIPFLYVPKDSTKIKYAEKRLMMGDHILKCEEFGVGFHSIKDMQPYVHGIVNGLIVEEINEENKDQTEEVKMIVR